MGIFLSYILTTYNKGPFLRYTLPPLLAALGDDDELVIADGGSTDDAVAYIRSQVAGRGNVIFFSGPDRGEAHGFNKAILASRGSFIKLITDDDLYNFSQLKRVKEHLRSNGDCDAVLANVLETNTALFPQHWLLTNEEKKFRETLSAGRPCDFIGISLFIRRESLPLLGLLNPSVKCVDAEFTLRFARLKAKVLFYTGVCAIRVENASSVYANLAVSSISEERDRMNLFWNDSYYAAHNRNLTRARRIIASFAPRRRQATGTSRQVDLSTLYAKSAEWLSAYDNSKAQFLRSWQ